MKKSFARYGKAKYLVRMIHTVLYEDGYSVPYEFTPCCNGFTHYLHCRMFIGK